jgi:F420-dependent oxidoreductase-like protein
MELILEAEKAGFDSAWSAEAYGSDAVTPVAWVLANTTRLKAGTAIMQLAARTPACTAMTAMTLDQLSNGRFLLGLGPSGPQVVEGWHGEPYGRPVTRIKEYVSIVRQILAREAPLVHDGPHYQIPFKGPGSTGLGKPLKSFFNDTATTEIYTAAITDNGVRAAAEVADGFFPVWMEPDRYDVFEDAVNEGFAKAGNGKGLDQFDVAPFVRMEMGDDLDACRMTIKHHMALYIGGMGARNKNFYNDYCKRLGYEEAAVKIQDLYLAGEKGPAAAAVPDQIVDASSLVGPADNIRARLAAWKDAAGRGHVGTLIVAAKTVEEIRLLAEELL